MRGTALVLEWASEGDKTQDGITVSDRQRLLQVALRFLKVYVSAIKQRGDYTSKVLTEELCSLLSPSGKCPKNSKFGILLITDV